MNSQVIHSICGATHTLSQSEAHDHVEYDPETVPPFFEGHPFFLEPVSRSHQEGRIIARFMRSEGRQITLTTTLFKDLIEIFVFFEENRLAIGKGLKPESFAVREDRLVVTQPWKLRHDLNRTTLLDNQKETQNMFFSGLSPGEMNCLERFYYGASRKSWLVIRFSGQLIGVSVLY